MESRQFLKRAKLTLSGIMHLLVTKQPVYIPGRRSQEFVLEGAYSRGCTPDP